MQVGLLSSKKMRVEWDCTLTTPGWLNSAYLSLSSLIPSVLKSDVVLWAVLGPPTNISLKIKVSIWKCGPFQLLWWLQCGGGDRISMMGRDFGPIGCDLMVKNDDRKVRCESTSKFGTLEF